MVSQNRLKLYIFKMQRFFAIFTPVQLNIFNIVDSSCCWNLYPLPMSTGFWHLNVISRNCIPKIYWKCQNAYFFFKIFVFINIYPRFFHIWTPPMDILSEWIILLWFMHTLPMFILNINTFPGVIWLVNRILCHFMQFLPPSSSIFSTLLDLTLQ